MSCLCLLTLLYKIDTVPPEQRSSWSFRSKILIGKLALSVADIPIVQELTTKFERSRSSTLAKLSKLPRKATTTASTTKFEWCKRKLKECEADHENCIRDLKAMSFLPTRLIKTGLDGEYHNE